MNTRDELLDEYGRADTAPLGTLAELKQKLDACRAEALHQAADEIDRAQHRYVVKTTVVNILRRRANQAGEQSSPTADATPSPDPLPAYLHALGEHGSGSERALYAAYRQAIAEAQRLRGTGSTESGDAV